MAARNDDPRLDISSPLKPANAVAAVVLVGGKYLLQLRDDKHGIFFPAHWGCFGGATDPGETREAALARELKEELGLSLSADAFRYFTRFDFDLGFARLPPIWRYFYELDLDPAVMPKLILGEGSALRLFTSAEILTNAVQFTPYDGFALWFHINRNRLRG